MKSGNGHNRMPIKARSGVKRNTSAHLLIAPLLPQDVPASSRRMWALMPGTLLALFTCENREPGRPSVNICLVVK